MLRIKTSWDLYFFVGLLIFFFFTKGRVLMQNETHTVIKIRKIQLMYHLQTSCQEANAVLVLISCNDLIYPMTQVI